MASRTFVLFENETGPLSRKSYLYEERLPVMQKLKSAVLGLAAVYIGSVIGGGAFRSMSPERYVGYAIAQAEAARSDSIASWLAGPWSLEKELGEFWDWATGGKYVSPKSPAKSQAQGSEEELAPATQAMKDACAREASGGFNYSANEIYEHANDIPDIAVRYSACVMRRRQGGY